jgi:hypothetical protein
MVILGHFSKRTRKHMKFTIFVGLHRRGDFVIFETVMPSAARESMR